MVFTAFLNRFLKHRDRFFHITERMRPLLFSEHNYLHPRLLIILLFLLFSIAFPLKVKADPSHPVIVIDPGHGGENLGGEYAEYTEKFLTMITATAMYDELTKFDHVTVYLTRDSDVDLSLKQRCQIAADHGADLLVCLHYNLSENHTLFGAECWVSMFEPYYSTEYAAADAFIEQFKKQGLFIRGIKTRMNDKGTDYYGILRESLELKVPTVLVEHAHMDEERDQPFCDEEEDWIAFGKMDAHAVAMYFGLSSEALGVDYSGYSNHYPEGTTEKMCPDDTPPVVAELSLESTTNDTATFSLEAQDPDSGLLYYDYSLDDGLTYSSLMPYREGGDPRDYTSGSVTFTVPLEKQKDAPRIIARAYNGYDLYTVSNEVIVEEFRYTQEELNALEGRTEAETTAALPDEVMESADDSRESTDGITEIILTKEEDLNKQEDKILLLLGGLFAFAGLLFALGIVLLIRHLAASSKRKHRRDDV